MFEATLEQGVLLRKVIDAIKDLVTEANWDINLGGMTLQAMDSSHVSLVSLQLKSEGFKQYRADRTFSLGINMGSMFKVLKCMTSGDSLTMKADDAGDMITFMFENSEEDKISNFELKLMEIDAEHLGIPDTEYQCVVRMPSSEFQRICRDLTVIGETLTISASKEGVRFSVSGDVGNGAIICKQTTAMDKEDDEQVVIELEGEPIQQTFALRYLNFFTKATPLSGSVSLSMSPDVPLVVEYRIDDLGSVRYFLAPKIEEEEES